MSSASHLDLLHAARLVQRSAVDGDVDGLHDELCQLRNALVAELHDPRCRCAHASEVGCRLARHGQRQLLHLVNDLLATTAETDPEGCACVIRSAELRALLIRQVRLQDRIRSRRPQHH